MFGIRYLKAPPTTYVMQYSSGRLKREGAGLAFYYFEPWATIAAVPLASTDAPFVFTEVTADFQEVTVQGQITYRVADARRLAALFDMSVDADLSYLTDDHEKLEERLVHGTQVLTRGRIGQLPLADAVAASDQLSEAVREGLRASDQVEAMGVEVLAVSVLAVRPTPETARALEAEAREALLRAADQAVYDRRNAAVEQERRIKENELRTEIAVEEQRRVIRETQMDADIAVEEQRARLVDVRAANERKDADARAYAIEVSLAPLKEADWRQLMVLGSGGSRPGSMIALAFQQLAENAGKIGTLNVSPELLQVLLTSQEE